jgi:pyruvate dehydrogenase E2 component (dihydrolipoamide acetyltransferase)
MIKEIKLPSAGQTTDQAVICEWLVKVGDSVSRGDVLLKAETDKAVLPVESFTNGQVIDILAQEGDTVDAGDVLVVIGDAEDAKAYTKGGAPAATAEPATTPAAEEEEFIEIFKDAEPVLIEVVAEAPAGRTNGGTNVKAMPNAKKLAKEAGIDINRVTSDNDGLIKVRDVKKYLESAKETIVDEAEFEVVKLSRMRQVIGKRMLQSVQSIPAFVVTVTVDMTKAIALKKLLAEKDHKISYNDLIMKAIAVTAKDFPLVRARYENDEIHIYRHLSVGMAVSIENGLVVPVQKDIESKGILDIAAANKTLIEKAKKGELTTEEMGCGTCTVSNLGMFGTTMTTPIINPPESFILGIGGILKQLEIVDGDIVEVQKMNITGSFDHRMMDGVDGIRILNNIKALLEEPAMMAC